MSDLIRRQDAIDVALTFLVEYCGAAFDEDMQKMMCKRLNALPSVEPERKKGEWIEYPDCLRYEGAYNDDHIVCSECGHVFSICNNCTEEFDFCPHCGADMRGE